MWTLKYCPEEEFLQELCTGCGLCAEVCPSGAVQMSRGMPDFLADRCIECGHCGAYCPVNAYGLDSFASETTPCGPGELLELMRRRRSVRKFKDKVPSEEEMKNIISVLSQSPTGQNSQGVQVTALVGRQRVRELYSGVRRLLKILSRTGLLWLAGKLSGMSDYFRRVREGEDLVFRDAPVVLFFHVPKRNVMARTDGLIAATYVMLHAESRGLGTLWNGVAEKIYPLVGSWHMKEFRGRRLTAVLCLGYSEAEALRPAPDRDYDILLKS
ncbi:MAG: 4Fe-4S dicluster domain-containing protein [Candidatus Aegiribacteria sp.]|nr:4Fe-4S dicluster domain-containing protein [Candidatus Aegiribacteria sp.]MBD3294045.1 4Fe-4S dicluster domain-containing protein [Candidatus Fermentibacteria bacterium]